MKQAFLIISLCGLLGGCVSRNLQVETSIDPGSAFSNAPMNGNVAPAIDDHAWWADFGDPQLAALVERSLLNNRSLAAQQAQLARAQALVADAQSELWPSIAAQGQLGSQETLINPDGTTHAASYGLGAQWKLDIFGQQRNKRQATLALAYATEDKLDGARLAIASNAAATYLNWLNLQAREQVLTDSVLLAEKTVTVLEALFREGYATDADVEQAKGNLALVKSRLPQLALAKEQLHNALAVLVGSLPSELELDANADWDSVHTPTLPALAPSTVLLSRPDVRAAQRQVQAQMYALGSAKAARYPSFTFNFLGQFQRLSFSIPGYPDLDGPISAVALDATIPLFTAGKIRAAIRGEEARLDSVAALYEETLLEAVAEVESAYRSCSENQTRAATLEESARSARTAAERVQALYEAGQNALTDVLQAQAIQLEQRDNSLQAQLDLFQSTLNLHDALGCVFN